MFSHDISTSTGSIKDLSITIFTTTRYNLWTFSGESSQCSKYIKKKIFIDIINRFGKILNLAIYDLSSMRVWKYITINLLRIAVNNDTSFTIAQFVW